MKTLVIGGTGTVGSLVVQGLLARNEPVHVLTRSAEKAKELPKGTQAVVGDLTKPEDLEKIFHGVERVFMLNPVSMTEAHEGLSAVNQAQAAKVKRFVYMTVHNVTAAPHMPHFGSKIPIELALKASGIPYTILQPNNFYQNDYAFKDAILQYGVYPQPIGDIGISRVDARDIADAAVITLTQNGHEGQTYPLVGPDVLTGARVAEIYSKHLGRPIAYGGNDLEAWQKQTLNFLPAWMVYDFKLMYRAYQEKGLIATADELSRLQKLLGHPLRTFDAFAAEMAKAWVR
ncbi:NmrA family NAD(P)-binding protein [Stigmatella sp. ncwal1]|uniref:NmrA family NAD(P)-binding protein n=1 Tax=Stigmatella ashevillensis TaxID=2995309 RepID=A0ABT5DM95_9BACT|nr:NmrA family NAD(P)-binding protein [Stigmatella ashevillena]MDC0714791.1 NmrA family NAD(P)-binding protein [Stigmatella ashevillena]